MKHSKHLRAGLTSLVAASMIMGCGTLKKEKDKAHKGAGANSQIDSDLVGTWERDCEKFDIFGVKYRKVKLDFGATLGYTREETVFDDEGCTQAEFAEKHTGTWAMVGNADGGAKQLNITIKDAFVKPNNAQSAEVMNNTKFCGIKDWQEGKETEITNVDCPSAAKEGEVIFEIYKLQDKKLYLGKTGFFSNGHTDASRPSEIDLSRPYDKQ